MFSTLSGATEETRSTGHQGLISKSACTPCSQRFPECVRCEHGVHADAKIPFPDLHFPLLLFEFVLWFLLCFVMHFRRGDDLKGFQLTSVGPHWAKFLRGTVDFVFIDCEHHCFSREQVAWTCASYAAAEITPVVRVLRPDASLVRATFDDGAHGVVVPYVETFGTSTSGCRRRETATDPGDQGGRSHCRRDPRRKDTAGLSASLRRCELDSANRKSCGGR